MVEISADLMKNPDLDVEMYAKMIQYIQKQHPKYDKQTDPDYAVKTRMIDKCTNLLHWFRYLPATPRTYVLTHDNTNATGITFPESTKEELKFGMGAKLDGSSWMEISDHAWFDVDDLVILFWFKFPETNSTDNNNGKIIIGKGNHFQIHVVAHTTTPNTISVNVWTGAALKTITKEYTPNTWQCLIMHADSSNLSVWLDNANLSQVATGGALDTNATDVGIFSYAGGGSNIIPSGYMFAGLTFGDKDIITDSQWRTDYQNGILDWQDANDEEITTIPFDQRLDEQPNDWSGFS